MVLRAINLALALVPTRTGRLTYWQCDVCHRTLHIRYDYDHAKCKP